MRAILILLLTTCWLPAADVTLRWNPNPEPDIAGYRIKLSPNPDLTWGATVDVGNVTEATIPGIDEDKPTYFALVAYNIAGLESIPSEVVMYRPKDGRLVAPTRPKIEL